MDPALFEGDSRVVAERAVAYWNEHDRPPGPHTADLLSDLRVGEPTSWSSPTLDPERVNKIMRHDLYEKYWDELSVYLAHCTTYRTGEHPGWDVEKMYEELNPTLIEFVTLTHLPRQMKNGVQGGSMALVEGEGAAHTASFKICK